MRRGPPTIVVVATAVAGLLALVALPSGVVGQPVVPEIGTTAQLESTNPLLSVPCGGSIQSAIASAHAGETIHLAACTYAQRFTVDKSVTILGAGIGRTIIRGPADIRPDVFGNPWTLEIANAATVTLAGFTLVVALQCIIYPANGYYYAGGGIGVGGGATLHLNSAVITTTGATQGAGCGTTPTTAGFLSFGTGVGFGLDYVVGTPPAHDLIGTGTVSGVTISGFGFGGPGVAVGGLEDSPAGSSAILANDRITTSVSDQGFFPAISVGYAGNSSAATIVDNFLSGLPGVANAIFEYGESSAYIAHNTVVVSGGVGGEGIVVDDSSTATIASNAIFVAGASGAGITVAFSSWAIISSNVITASTTAYGYAGIFMYDASAAISYNSISDMECEFNPAEAAPTPCGPDYATEAQGYGIQDLYDAGLGTTIEHNLIAGNDVGIELAEGCPACVVSHNALIDNVDYGLAGIDGNYTFLNDWVVGGMYAVGAIAYSVNTTVMLDHVALLGPSVDLYYFEVDFVDGTAAVVGR